MTNLRTLYMSGVITHQQYYSHLADQMGITENFFGEYFLIYCRSALWLGNKHLNENHEAGGKMLSLDSWDAKGWWLTKSNHAKSVLSAAGESMTPSAVVCVLKAAVRDIVEKKDNENSWTLDF